MTSLAAVRDCPDHCLACFLHARLDTQGCDGSPALVHTWAAAHDADAGPVLDHLESRGGFCDCEVLSNALSSARLVVEDLVLSCGS